jgi:predicted 2-oxoglutarate/Fe(II)-dependent dioxygenase YbiX
MTPEESQEYCRSIEQAIPGFVVTSFRPMLYEAGAWLRNHLDSPSNEYEGESTHSLNIMLVDPSSFDGGHFLIGNDQRRYIELAQGDGIMYDYSQLHEVKRISKGKRWIINVRLKNA